MTAEGLKQEIYNWLPNKPKNWREGQAVFNYIDQMYGVARDAQFGYDVDCFYDDSKIDAFIETCTKIINERMKTYRFLIKNNWMPWDAGYANGYVAVPEGHLLYGKDYDDLKEIWVHGGLTYSGKMIPHHDFELLDGELPQEYWCFGFDTAHWGDNLDNCDREFCINEVTRLQTQIENYEVIQEN